MFQPGLNYSLKNELEKRKSQKSEIDQVIENDFAAFKRKSQQPPLNYLNDGLMSGGDIMNIKNL
jgi:hypothetical protein